MNPTPETYRKARKIVDTDEEPTGSINPVSIKNPEPVHDREAKEKLHRP